METYYILIDNKQQGPYNLDELREKGINARTMVWRQGMSGWQPAGNVPELRDLLSSVPPVPDIDRPMPKTWLVESILVTIFCCLPFGIAGIVNASKIEGHYFRGEYNLALRYSNAARKWTLWGFFTALVFIAGYILVLIAIAVAAATV